MSDTFTAEIPILLSCPECLKQGSSGKCAAVYTLPKDRIEAQKAFLSKAPPKPEIVCRKCGWKDTK